MKSILKILFAPLLWILNSCSPLGEPVDASISQNHYYNSSKSDIIYSPYGNWFELGKTPMQADVENFQVLNNVLSKDGGRVYFEFYPFDHPKIDLASFTAKSQVYMSDIGLDKDNVYHLSTGYTNGETQVVATTIPNADPATFEQTDPDWGRDAKNHYYRYRPVPVDYTSFKVLNNYFSLDKDTVYQHYNDTFLPIEADAKTFGILDESLYAKDANEIFYLLFDKEEADKAQLLKISLGQNEVRLLNPYYLQHGDTIYFEGTAITGADVKTFEIISELYAKDIKNVFFKDRMIPGADAASFHYSDSILAVRDKNGKYFDGVLAEAK